MTVEMNSQLSLIEREGLAWIDRLTSGVATQRDLDDMKRWRQQSVAHAEALSAAARLRKRVKSYDGDALGAMTVPASGKKLLNASNMNRRLFLGGAIAAGLGAAVIFRSEAYLAIENLQADYHTNTGERRRIEMPSANVQLNSQSAIALETGGFKLITGEVSADVNKAPGLKVRSGNAVVSAVNAHLNVRKTAEETCVICMAGQVEISHPAQNAPLVLAAGEQSRFTSTALEQPRPADMALATAWQKGQIIFRDAPLTEVVAELNRYRPGHVMLTNSALEAKTFNGVFSLDRMDDAISQISRISGAKLVNLPGHVVLLT